MCNGIGDSPVLIADLGIWIPQAEALFDVQVTDTDAASYVGQSVSAVLSSDKEEKKRKYLSATELHHASFTCFVVSVDGALGHEALMLIKCLADRMSSGWGKKLSCMDQGALGLCYYLSKQPLLSWITCALAKWYQY